MIHKWIIVGVFNILLLYFVTNNDAARILAYFPTPSISHQVVFRPLTQELARIGHEVFVITTDPAFPKNKAPPNLTEIDVHDISYKIWLDTFMKTGTGNQDDIVNQLCIGFDALLNIFIEQLQVKEVKNVIFNPSKKYDLLIVEALVRPALSLSYIMKDVPFIQMSSFGAFYGNYESMGAPTHMFLYPTMVRQRLVNLTISEKMREVYYEYQLKKEYYKRETTEVAAMREIVGKDMPEFNELRNNVEMLFLNLNPIFEGNHPVPPNVIYMGGIHRKPRKELPNDLKSYLDSSKDGVIYISFGTNVNTSLIPKDQISKMISALSELPYNVLWKWNEDILHGQTKNIKISKWLPQSDLLYHPNIKAFVTQGGLQSTDEAISAGVPLIGIPMLGDQWYNVEKYLKHKIGVRLDMGSFTKEQFLNAIKTVIEKKSYRQNIMRLHQLMEDQPQSPQERAIWWIEYVIRHKGAKHLRSPAANITWYQYLEIDLTITIIVSFVFAIFIVVLLTKKTLSLLLGFNDNKKFKRK